MNSSVTYGRWHTRTRRETLRSRLMLALYRSGGPGGVQRLRTLLADELGIDPSAGLAELYERILRQSPELSLAPVGCR